MRPSPWPLANIWPLVPGPPASDDGRVRTKIGKDGKTYPAQMPPPAAWRWEVIKLTHLLAHEQGLTEDQTRRALAVAGYRRSAGSVHYDLTRAVRSCPVCCPPEPVPAVARPWAGAQSPEARPAWPAQAGLA